jgi:hypothetical protein
MRDFDQLVDEIRKDEVLRWYGAAMGLLVTLTAIFWLWTGVARGVAPGTEAICWPMFPGCQSWRIFPAPAITAFIVALLLISLVDSALFLSPRWTKAAWVLLLCLNLAKFSLIAFDYRFRLNQHIMAFWITMAFLFLPRKEATLKLLIVLFYFWAGLLKLSPEWISGAALYTKPWLFHEGAALTVACVYVVILELFVVWLVLWDRTKLAWAALFQLCVFHVFSWPIVGFYYPTLMFAILSLFPLSWLRSGPSTFERLARPREMWPAYALAAAFSMAQLIPRFMPGDTALTGEGRLFALHMFDSNPECEAYATVRDGAGRSRTIDLLIHRPVRIHCDPITYLSRARNLCEREKRSTAGLQSLDLTVRSRRATGDKLRDVVNITDMCSKQVSYSLFKHNDWIKVP